MAQFFPPGAKEILDRQAARAAADELSRSTELAVDLEADAMHAFRARLCFVQVGTDDQVYLFDTLVPEVEISVLSAILEDPNRRKFFHASQGDLQYLAENRVRVRGLFDTHRAATLLGWPKVGLADLARQLLNIELPKEHQQSDFSERPLPAPLRQYIADDVRYLCEIGRQVIAECERADILEEVLLDCQRLSDHAAARPEAGTDFRPKVARGGRSEREVTLALAISRELHRLRLLWAEAANVPMGRMLSNMAIQSLAEDPPETMKELRAAAGVRGPFVREHGEEALRAIVTLAAKAAQGQLHPRPEDEPPRDPAKRRRTDALKAFRQTKAIERNVTPSVVLPNSLVDDLADAQPRTLEAIAQVPYFGEKRLRLYGEELLRVLRSD